MLNYDRVPKSGDIAWDIWHARIANTLHWRSKVYWNGDRNWDLAYEIFKGLHWRDKQKDDISSDNPSDRITVNITGSTINSIGPFIMNGPTQFKCQARKPSGTVSAFLQQEILNYEWKHKKMHNEIKKVRDDALTIGHGIIKTGFTLEVDTAKAKADGDINYDDMITAQSPFIKRVAPKLFLKDPNASDHTLKTAMWCAEIFFMPTIDILANNKFDQSVIQSIKRGEYTVDTKDNIYKDNLSAKLNDWANPDINCPESELAICYEVWEKKFNQVLTFVSGVRPPIRVRDNPYGYLPDGEFPFKQLDYIPLQDEPYGIGIPYLIQDQQFELNRHRTSGFEHRRRFNRKYAVVVGALDTEEEINKLVDGPDGTVVKVKQANAITAIQDAPLSQDYERIEANIKQDIYELTGTDALFRGGNLPSRTTGVEVNARQGNFAIKLDDRIQALDEFTQETGGQVLAHIKDNYVAEKVIRIVGLKGIYWVRYNRQDIADEVDIETSTMAAPKIDPNVDQQQRLLLMQILMNPVVVQMAQAGLIQGLDFTQLIKWVLEGFHSVTDAGRFFQASLIPSPPIQEISPTQLGELEGGMISGAGTGGLQGLNLDSIMKTLGGAALTNNGFQMG